MHTLDVKQNNAPEWIDTLLDQVSKSFEIAEPEQILEWANATFADGLVIGTAFGASGMVLLDIALKVNPDIDIFYIDTGLFFDETYALIKKAEARYGREFIRMTPEMDLDEQAEAYGDDLWLKNADKCCLMRKVLPMRKALQGRTAWVTALRRDQSPSRARTPILKDNSKFNVVKIAPLANWSEREIWEYILEHDLDYNELHDKGFPSIGCKPCTGSVKAGEDLRAGRWRGENKTECGLHV